MNRFGRSLSSEFRKATATKTWWVLGIVIALYAAMMTATFAFMFSEIAEQLGGGSMPGTENSAHLVYSSVTTFGYVVPLVFGALMATGEIRHRTIGLTFLTEPSRGIVLAGKTVVLLGVGIILGVFGIIGGVGAAAPLLAATDQSTGLDNGDTWLLLTRVLISLSVWAVIGFGMGLLVRGQVFAVVLALVFTQFLEPVLRMGAQFWEWSAEASKYLPGSATDAFVGASVMNDLAAADPEMAGGSEPLSIGVGFAVLAAYAVVTVLAGWWFSWRRDISPSE